MHATKDGRRLPFDPHVRADLVLTPAGPPPVPGRPAWRLLAVAVVWAFVVAGVGLRTHCLVRDSSFWIDEAMLALNVVHRSPAQLLEPLDLNQGAPIGFLLAAKACERAFGPGETALRLVPFAAGLLGFLLFVPLAYRALPVAAARTAVCLAAITPYLAGYAAEFKQYECDAAVAVGLMWVGLPVWRTAAGRGRLFGLAAAGAVAVWCSHPAAFVLGGVGLAVLADAAVRRDRTALVARLVVVACWAVSFGTCYLLFTRKLGMNDYLLTYWAGQFMPFPPRGPGDLAWVCDYFFKFFESPGGFGAEAAGMGGLAGVLFLVGGRVLVRADWRLLAALVVPLGLALLASGLKKYPFAGRLLLFAVPAALLLVGYGAATVAGLLGRTWPGAGAVLLAALFAAPVSEAVWLARKPLHNEMAREAIAQVHAGWEPGDKLYVFYGAAPAFAYYSPHYPFPPDAVRVGAENRGGPQQLFRDELLAFRGEKRVWVLLAHRQGTEDAAVRAYLDGLGHCDELTRRSDAVVLRYDLTGRPGELARAGGPRPAGTPAARLEPGGRTGYRPGRPAEPPPADTGGARP